MVAGSRVVNMASIAGLIPSRGLSTYSATKRFVVDLSRTLDYELGPVGIHVCAVCPKFMETGFLASPGDEREVRRMTTIGYEKPADVVRKALHAAVLGRSTCVTSPDMLAASVMAKVLPASWVTRRKTFSSLLAQASRGGHDGGSSATASAAGNASSGAKLTSEGPLVPNRCGNAPPAPERRRRELLVRNACKNNALRRHMNHTPNLGERKSETRRCGRLCPVRR